MAGNLPIIYTPDPRFNVTGRAPVPSPLDPSPQPDTSVVDAFASAWRLDNPVYALSDILSRPTYAPEPSYDVADDPEVTGPTSPYRNHLDSFVGVRSKAQAQAIMGRITQEESDKEKLARAGWPGVLARMAAGSISPDLFVPIGGWLALSARAGRAASLGVRALEGAALVGSTEAVREAVLHQAQETRTFEESLWNTISAAAMGAVLGGIVGAAGQKVLARSVAGELQGPTLSGEPLGARPTATGAGQSAGAASVHAPQSSGEIAGALGVEKIVGSSDVRTRVSLSDEIATRQAGDNLAENPLTRVDSSSDRVASEGGPVEALIKEENTKLTDALVNMDQQFKDYFYGKQARFFPIFRSGVSAALGRAGGKMDYQAFKQAVTDAWIDGDVHPIPQVQAAANGFRSILFNPIEKRAIDAGVPNFTQGMKPQSGDKGYAPRVYDNPKIDAQRPTFKAILTKAAQRAREKERTRIEVWRGERVAALRQEIDDLSMSGEARATTTFALEDALNKVKQHGQRFDPVVTRLEALHSQAHAQRQLVKGGSSQAAGDLRATTAEIQREVQDAGSEYASYVTKRNLLQTRLRNLRGGVEGRELQSEILRGKIVDTEASNVDRLWRMHRAITKLIAEFDHMSPEAVAAERARLVTSFAHVLDRSNSARARYKDARIAAQKQLAEHPADEGGTPPPKVEVGANPALAMRKRPVLDMLKRRGGVDPESPLAGELRHAGLTAKNSPGLFRKGGMGAADNIPLSEEEIFRDRAIDDGNGYINQDDIIEAAREEMGGNPLRTREEYDALDEYQARQDAAAGAKQDMASLKADARLKRLDAAEETRLAEMNRLTAQIGDVDNVDVEGATRDLKMLIERRVAQSAEVVENEGKIVARMVDKLRAANPDDVKLRIEGLKKRVDLVQTKRGSNLADMTDAELDAMAEDIIDNITAHHTGRMWSTADLKPGERGAAKERVLNFVRTNELKPFLVRDAEVLAKHYVRSIVPDVALHEKFGSTDMATEIGRIMGAYNRRIATAATEKERTALKAKREADVRDISAIRDILRGTYGAPSNPHAMSYRLARNIKAYNYTRLLGGMTLAALPDLGRMVMVHGLANTLRTVFAPFAGGLHTLRLAMKEAQLAGTALDWRLDSRALALADIGTEFGHTGSRFERGLHAATSRFGVVSLMAPWNAELKSFVGAIVQTRMLKAIEALAAGKAVKAKELALLTDNYVDKAMALRIAKEADKFHREGGIIAAQSANWADQEAAKVFRRGLARDVDRIIVTPGTNKALWMQGGNAWLGQVGPIIGQFKSFAVASVSRTLLAGLQQRDMAVLNGVILSLVLGALSYKVRDDIAGIPTADPNTPEGLKVWAGEAFDRSGLLGWLNDANNIAEKFTYGKVGMSALTGRQASRYASRNQVGALLGPSFDLLGDFGQMAGAPFSPNGWGESDTHTLRKLMPLQNLFYLRTLFDQAEQNANNAFGIQQRAN